MAIQQKHAVAIHPTLLVENYILNAHVDQLLNEFSLLKDDWDENDAIAPHASVVSSAKQLIHLLEKHGKAAYHAAPGPNGEIMVDIRNKNKAFEIIFYRNRSVSVQIPEIEKPIQKSFEFNDLPSLLIWLNKNEK